MEVVFSPESYRRYQAELAAASQKKAAEKEEKRKRRDRMGWRFLLLMFYTLIGFVALLLVLGIIGVIVDTTASPETHALWEKERAERDAITAQKAAACAADLRCTADKIIGDVPVNCSIAVERIVLNDYKWIDYFSDRFKKFAWTDSSHKYISFYGDGIKMQNGYGAFVRSKYECVYNVEKNEAVLASASMGSLD